GALGAADVAGDVVGEHRQGMAAVAGDAAVESPLVGSRRDDGLKHSVEIELRLADADVVAGGRRHFHNAGEGTARIRRGDGHGWSLTVATGGQQGEVVPGQGAGVAGGPLKPGVTRVRDCRVGDVDRPGLVRLPLAAGVEILTGVGAKDLSTE